MSEEKTDEIPMAECGSCRAIIPLNSEECPECGISFSGVSNESLGECGACKALVPLDSKSCPECGVYFVADDVVDVLRNWFVETGIEVTKLFSKMDSDNDGSIDAEELKDGLLKLNLADLPPSQVERLVKEFDSDNDGKISLEELVFTITGEELEVSESSSEPQLASEKEYSENVLTRVMEKFSITDRDAFLLHAQDYDSNDNGYLTEGEFKTAAEAFAVSSGDDESSEDVAKEEIEESEEVENIDSDEETDEGEVDGAEEENLDQDEAEAEQEISDEVEESDDEESPEENIEDSAMYRLGIAASQGGLTIREVFESMDSDDDGLIDGPELQKGIEEISGDQLSPGEVFEILKSLDEDSDGRVNPMELVNALEELELGIKSDSSGAMRDPVSILIEAMDDAGTNPGRVFRDLDKNGDGSINISELRTEVESFIEESLTDEEMDHLFERLDNDGDGFVDMYEFIENLEEYEDEEADEESSLSSKVEFPSKMQSRMMSKRWNDVYWPIIHAGLFIFVLLWIVNASLAPFVSGEEGSIALDTELGLYDDGENVYLQGDIYPCVDSVQTDGCKNSLTPLAGEASSMPAGWYWDGIMFIILGSIGFVGSLFTHLYIVPGWRARAKAIRESEKERQEVDEEIASGDSDDAEDTLDEEPEVEESDDGNMEEDSDDGDEEDEDYDDDDIDIGSHIGLVLEDEEIFGIIVEFDDDENLVTIEEDGTGDLVTGYQDDMFIED